MRRRLSGLGREGAPGWACNRKEDLAVCGSSFQCAHVAQLVRAQNS